MAGGGPLPRPGEISLAHNGVLFLDEMPEFDRRVLEVLRQPLEEGRVSVARAARTTSFPARFMLIAAMNPCPCGFSGTGDRPCSCPVSVPDRYQKRISGPLRDFGKKRDVVWIPSGVDDARHQLVGFKHGHIGANVECARWDLAIAAHGLRGDGRAQGNRTGGHFRRWLAQCH